MSTGELIVIGLRLVIPLLILRYWLVGGIVAMVLDALDVVIIELIGHGGFGSHYAELDKLLDTYYLSLELFVAWRWSNPWTRWPAIALFVVRLIGVVLFEIVDEHYILFIFPNLFENWWLYCVFVLRFFPKLEPKSVRSVVIPMILLLIPKMIQEYILHVAEAEPWNWTKENILHTK